MKHRNLFYLEKYFLFLDFEMVLLIRLIVKVYRRISGSISLVGAEWNIDQVTLCFYI